MSFNGDQAYNDQNNQLDVASTKMTSQQLVR